MRRLAGLMSKVSQSVVMLEECNKEILVGKRRLDCLSCGDTMSQAGKSTEDLLKIKQRNITTPNVYQNVYNE